MNREKQIDAMAKVVQSPSIKWGLGELTERGIAEAFYNADYRKVDEDYARQCTCYALGCLMAEQLEKKVAEEILELIDRAFSPVLVYNGYTIKKYLAELKKKYIGKDTNVTTKESEKYDG